MREFIIKHDRVIHRLLEILPGLVSWNIILFPYWGIFLIPTMVAYFVLIFNIYWFYQSLQIAITAVISHLRIQASIAYDWLGDLKTFPDWQKVHHVVIIPPYKEPPYMRERTFNSLAEQTLPRKKLIVVLAMEKKEPKEDRAAKVKYLRSKFGQTFAHFFVTVHTLVPGAVVGKASNERPAALGGKEKLRDKAQMDINYLGG